MGRLIDADKLKADLEKAISKNEDMDFLDFLRAASVIDAQPTAYDPDKVVEQLKKKAIPVLDEDGHIIPESNVKEVYEIEMVALSDAITIVKGGGVDG